MEFKFPLIFKAWQLSKCSNFFGHLRNTEKIKLQIKKKIHYKVFKNPFQLSRTYTCTPMILTDVVLPTCINLLFDILRFDDWNLSLEGLCEFTVVMMTEIRLSMNEDLFFLRCSFLSNNMLYTDFIFLRSSF